MSVHTLVVLFFSFIADQRWHHKPDNHDKNSALSHLSMLFSDTSNAHCLTSYTSTTQTTEHNGRPNINKRQSSKAILRWPTRDGQRVGLSSAFVPFVNPQMRQNLASVINSDPQREQNILLLTLPRLRLQEGKRWETLHSASRQLVSDITLKIRKGSGN